LIVLDAGTYLLEKNSVFKDRDELYTGLGKKTLLREEIAEHFCNNCSCLVIVTTILKACCSSIMFGKSFV